MDQPGKVVYPSRGQLKKENIQKLISLSPYVPENLISRETGSAVPSRVGLVIL